MAAVLKAGGHGQRHRRREIGIVQDQGRRLAAGRLVRVLAEWTSSFPGLCLYHPGHRHVPAELRALIELIREPAATS